jgi:hypothetical protein
VEDKSITATAARLNGHEINGDGQVIITAGGSALSANLGQITTTTSSYTGTDGTTITGLLPAAGTCTIKSSITLGLDNLLNINATYTIVEDKSITATAARLTGKTITGAGFVTINELNSYDTAVLAGITATGTVIVNTLADVSFSGTFPATNTSLDGDFTYTVTFNAFTTGKTYTVVASNTLISTATLLTGKTITGAGNLTVTDLTTSVYNGTNINMSGIYKIQLSGEMNISTNFAPAGGTLPILVPVGSLTIKATQISDLSLNDGSGGLIGQTVLIKNLENYATGNYSNIRASSCTYDVTGNIAALQARLKNLSTSIFMNINSGITVTVGITGGYIAEVLRFTSAINNSYSNKYITIQLGGTFNFDLNSGSATELVAGAGIFSISDPDISNAIDTAGNYDVTSSTPYSFKTDTIPIVTVDNVLVPPPEP